ncbi:hypothetical protein [Agromyces larvae]|uniref:HK97 gp10 family phage protein n=1 Tax=Agromyces larvae TaxID=2929802 RepID=A0ABY4BX04_9MICO|nr:hypothetical protein [Agromyces larvae]UOE43745.1 hypothetical protein MTO99_16475 [Agromyces larvae]
MAPRSRHGIVSAEAAADLQAVTRAVRAAPAELARLLDATAREQLSGVWGEELGKRPASGAQQKFVLAEAEAIPNAAGLTVTTGDDWGHNAPLPRIYEFGTKNRDKTTTYRRRIPGTRRTTSVTRRTRRQLPERRAQGWIAYPAANATGARVFRMWAQLVHKVTHDWMEGKLG